MFATAVRETRVSLVALAFTIEREWMNMRSIIPKAMGHCAVLAALLGTAVPLAAQVRSERPARLSLISGTVVGAGNRTPVATHVRLRHVRSLDPDGAPEIATVTADSRGRFALAVTHPGSFAVEVSGAAHETRTVLVTLQPGDSLNLEVRLRQVPLRTAFDSAMVVGDFNGFKADSTGRSLRADADGRLVVEIPTTKDSLVYALARVARRGLTPNAGRDGVLRTADGAFRSVVVARNGIARVVVDPALFRADTTAEWVRYSGTEAAELARIVDSIGVYQRDQSLVARGLPAAQWTGRVARAQAALAKAPSPRLRAIRLLELLAIAQSGGNVAPSVGRQSLREIPPAHPLWSSATSLSMALPMVAVQLADSVLPQQKQVMKRDPLSAADSARYRRHLPHQLARLDSTIMASRDDFATAQWLQFAVAMAFGWEPERTNRYLARMQTEFADRFATVMALQVWGGNRPLRVGATLPSFSVAALGSSTTRIDDRTLAGKTVLIDFWATWCTPCLEEMGPLHDAWQQYQPRGLEMLSVSFDGAVADVNKFRTDRWAMPWQHAWEEGGLGAPTLMSLGLYGLPQIVLVGPDGTILAEGRDLRGGALLPTLAKFLK
jgi:thiol-disulfide isomerase/thioredoxin